jgi:hypothetical protein
METIARTTIGPFTYSIEQLTCQRGVTKIGGLRYFIPLDGPVFAFLCRYGARDVNPPRVYVDIGGSLLDSLKEVEREWTDTIEAIRAMPQPIAEELCGEYQPTDRYCKIVRGDHNDPSHYGLIVCPRVDN